MLKRNSQLPMGKSGNKNNNNKNDKISFMQKIIALWGVLEKK